MEDLIEKARQYATSAYARIGQLRKYTLQPYDVHLRGVAQLVSSVTTDTAMIAASWLHDTVEDTPATFEDLEREFGADVMNLVKELTDISRPGDGNRAARKLLDRQHIAMASPRAKTIKLADIMDNCEDICRHDPRFGRVYLEEMRALMEVLHEGDARLYSKALKRMAESAGKLAPLEKDATADDTFPAGMLSGRHGIRLFTQTFTAQDILEPLFSFDDTSLKELQSVLQSAPHLQIVGIRSKGEVTGYLEADPCSVPDAKKVRPIDPRQRAGLETSLGDVIHILTLFTYCFVTLEDTVIGVISRRDIEKPVVRMWLFGIIILIEMIVVDEIRCRWGDGSWVPLLSAARLDKAEQLQAERRRRGYSADLLDCLQFSDKLRVIINEPGFAAALGFPSSSMAKRALKELESLRNNLAHGQDIGNYDWPPIVRLARRVQQLFSK
ncbi:HD domain-containing protein [Geomonas sp. RF6]|uniref:HD domain-containing protein n=1 Tax=Geomonas sp. RF6 TaxID=2897342 RepID=UPI001E52EFDA|nr:HD domain-containing protein [Geomonas sp. RF6]UFS71896.1 HD domain-containing protein [Geomonas sp. RF6]